MDNITKLKAVAILVCSGVTGVALADMTTTTTTTNPNGATPAVQTTTVATVDDAAMSNNINTVMSDYAGKVNVTVKDGVVYLAGELPSNTDYEKVVTLAGSTKGVTDVNVDKLTVKDSSQPLTDSYITAKVKGALIRSDVMAKDIPSWSISVETKDGQVFLSGTTETVEQKQKILDVVKQVTGVTGVSDKMEIVAAKPAEDMEAEDTN